MNSNLSTNTSNFFTSQMAKLFYPLLLFFFLFTTTTTSAPTPTFNIVSYGAKGDGSTDSTKAFLSAWAAACGSVEGAAIYVPVGKFLMGHLTLSGPCQSNKIAIQMDGTLIAPSDYESMGDEWIAFDHVDGVSIYGGTIDGQGSSLWTCKAFTGKTCPSGASSLVFANSKNVKISGLTSTNSKLYHIVIHANCQFVTIQGVKIFAPADSPNTDGIHVQLSSYVNVLAAGIKTGDDCISIGPGTTNLWIEGVACGPGHGISIGSLGKDYQEAGVQNVTVKTATFTGSENGVRIKTWGRPSDGFVRGIVFEHVVMQSVRNPIIIDQNYCPDSQGCPGKSSGVKISDVTYNDIHGTSSTPVAVNFACSSSNPCSAITLEDIKLTYGNAAAESSCSHVVGTNSGFVIPPSCP